MNLPGTIVAKHTVEYTVTCVGAKINPWCVQTIHLGTFSNQYDSDNPHRAIKRATTILKNDYGWRGKTGLWMCPACQYVREQNGEVS